MASKKKTFNPKSAELFGSLGEYLDLFTRVGNSFAGYLTTVVRKLSDGKADTRAWNSRTDPENAAFSFDIVTQDRKVSCTVHKDKDGISLHVAGKGRRPANFPFTLAGVADIVRSLGIEPKMPEDK